MLPAPGIWQGSRQATLTTVSSSAAPGPSCPAAETGHRGCTRQRVTRAAGPSHLKIHTHPGDVGCGEFPFPPKRQSMSCFHSTNVNSKEQTRGFSGEQAMLNQVVAGTGHELWGRTRWAEGRGADGPPGHGFQDSTPQLACQGWWREGHICHGWPGADGRSAMASVTDKLSLPPPSGGLRRHQCQLCATSAAGCPHWLPGSAHPQPPRVSPEDRQVTLLRARPLGTQWDWSR